MVKVRPDATCSKCKIFVEHYSFTSIQQIVRKFDAESVRLVHRAVCLDENYPSWQIFGASALELLKYSIRI